MKGAVADANKYIWISSVVESLVFLSTCCSCYTLFLITVKWRGRFEGSEPVTRNQIILFLSGIAMLYIVKGSPVDLWVIFYLVFI